jgi:hypothetical protein
MEPCGTPAYMSFGILISPLTETLNFAAACSSLYSFGIDHIENTASNSSSVVACLFVAVEMCYFAVA